MNPIETADDILEGIFDVPNKIQELVAKCPDLEPDIKVKFNAVAEHVKSFSSAMKWVLQNCKEEFTELKKRKIRVEQELPIPEHGCWREERFLGFVPDSGEPTTDSGKFITVWISGLDESTTQAKVEEAIRAVIPNFRNFTMTEIRRAGRGPRMIWVKCPAHFANILCRQRTLVVGSAVTTVQKSTNRCRRCLGTGHDFYECTGPDNSNRCFNCGRQDHWARACTRPMKCLSCHKPGHRIGSKICPRP